MAGRFPAKHEQAHRDAHEADIAVTGIQSLDTGIGNTPATQAADQEGDCKTDREAAAERCDEPELPHLIGSDLGHRDEHQRGQCKINREPIEVVGRRTIEHTEISANESGQDQREDRQC